MMRLPFFRRRKPRPFQPSVFCEIDPASFEDLGLPDAERPNAEPSEDPWMDERAGYYFSQADRDLPPFAKVDRWVIVTRAPECDLFLRGDGIPTTGTWLTDNAAAARRFGSIDDAVRCFHRKGLSPELFEIVPA